MHVLPLFCIVLTTAFTVLVNAETNAVPPLSKEWEREMREAAKQFGAGDLRGARDHTLNALKQAKGEIDGDNLRAAESHYLLGEIFSALGKYEDAVFHARRSLLMRSDLLGVDHAQVGFSANSLAQIHQDRGAYQDALPLNDQAITIWKQRYGDTHPHLAVPLNNQGRILNIIGKHLEQQALIARGEGQIDEADSRKAEANLSYARALAYFRESERVLKTLPDQGGVNLGACYQNMADTQLALGQLEEAEALYRRALKILGKALGEKEPFVILCLGRLAQVSHQLGKNEEAETFFQHALKYTAENLGSNPEHIYHLLTDMADFYEAIGNKEKAVSCRASATLIKERMEK